MKQQKINMFVSTMIIVIVFFVIGQSAIGVVYGYGYGYGHEHHDSDKDTDKDVTPTPTPTPIPTPTPTPVVAPTPTSEVMPTTAQTASTVAPIREDEKKKEIIHKKTLKVSAKKVRKGDVLIQGGKYFSKKATIALYFSKNDGGYYAPVTVRTNKEGSFSVNYKVNKAEGVYKWYAVDTKSGGQTKASTYTIVK